MKSDVILCDCKLDEHNIIIHYDIDDDHEIYVSYHLTPIHNIFKRIWYGIKYVFGYRSKYGEYGELILNSEDDTIEKLENVLERLKIAREKLKKS